MRRDTTGYSIRSRGESGTGFMFFVILLLPFIVAVIVLSPAGALQLLSPVLDSMLQRVGASSAVANTRTESAPAAVTAPIRLPVANWDVRDGHFFTQTNGQPPLSSLSGFLVSDAGNMPFWGEYRRLGGDAHLGYPLSQRFVWRGATVQVFQRGAMQSAGSGNVSMINVMDELTTAGKDDLLAAKWFIPKPVAADFGMPGDPIAARLGLLSSSKGMDERFKGSPDALALFGLPTSAPIAMNEYVTSLRTQRTALHQWKQDGAWGKANDVTVANSGEIALEAGLFQNPVTTPEAPPAS